MNEWHQIVFSDRPTQRLLRHLLFWIGQFVFWALMTASFFTNVSKTEYLLRDLRLHTFFLPDIFYTYVVSYFLVAKFLARGRNNAFVFAVVAVTILTYIAFLLLRLWDYNMFNAPRDVKLQLLWTYSIKFTSLGPPVICAMFLSLKFLKNYYRKTEENKLLIAENTTSQLGQLKAQIHPHFLFNTLSNIHSFAMTNTKLASELVSRLSDTMKYLIYECEATYVDLGTELRMIGDYCALQTVRYNDGLNIRMNIEGDCHSKRIAPLFLVPLVENAFKHGTSQVIDNPWINLDINIRDSSLVMRLSNNKPAAPAPAAFRSGIGLSNVRKRLQLMYPSNHSFHVSSTHDTFCVEIELPLLMVTTKASVGVVSALPPDARKLNEPYSLSESIL
jgi:hypothetical protein